MNFSKSGLQLNYYRRANFKSRYLKTTLGTFFENSEHPRNISLCMYHPWVTFHSLNVFDFQIFYFCPFYGPRKVKKWQNIQFFDLSRPIKWAKINNLKIEDTQTVKRHPRMLHAQGNVSRMFTVLKKCT